MTKWIVPNLSVSRTVIFLTTYLSLYFSNSSTDFLCMLSVPKTLTLVVASSHTKTACRILWRKTYLLELRHFAECEGTWNDGLPKDFSTSWLSCVYCAHNVKTSCELCPWIFESEICRVKLFKHVKTIFRSHRNHRYKGTAARCALHTVEREFRCLSNAIDACSQFHGMWC